MSGMFFSRHTVVRNSQASLLLRTIMCMLQEDIFIIIDFIFDKICKILITWLILMRQTVYFTSVPVLHILMNICQKYPGFCCTFLQNLLLDLPLFSSTVRTAWSTSCQNPEFFEYSSLDSSTLYKFVNIQLPCSHADITLTYFRLGTEHCIKAHLFGTGHYSRNSFHGSFYHLAWRGHHSTVMDFCFYKIRFAVGTAFIQGLKNPGF